MWLGLIILAGGFFGGAALILYRPDLLDLEARGNIAQTQAVFEQTAIALEGTADAVQTAADGLNVTANNLELTAQFNSGQSFDNDSTQVALDNAAIQLEQASTQAALDVQATETSVAIANAQQATEAAVAFQNTQVAFDRAATQAELAYQGTQAALNRDATAVALGFATEAAPAEDILPSLPPPTITAQPLFTDGFESGLNDTRWTFSAVQDWTITADATLQSERSSAWLLTQNNDFTAYTMEVELIPLTGPNLAADYHLLLNVQGINDAGPDGVALRISYDGDRVTAVGLHNVELEEIYLENGLLNRPLPALISQQVNAPATATILVTVEVNAGQVRVWIDRNNLIDTPLELPPSGALGVQVPVGAAISRVDVRQ